MTGGAGGTRQGSAKGDVFDLVQFLDPSLNFGQVRKALRPFVGLSPTYPEALPKRETTQADALCPSAGRSRPRLRPRFARLELPDRGPRPPAHRPPGRRARPTPCGMGLTGARGSRIATAAGQVCHIEVRGPDFKGSLRGGTKTLFRLAGGLSTMPAGRARGADRRAEPGGPREHPARHTLRGNRRRHRSWHDRRASSRPGRPTGGRERLGRAPPMQTPPAIALPASIKPSPSRPASPFERLRPTDGTDWNDVLRQGRGV